MEVHLIDGTYELFRCYFGAPPYRNKAGREVGAARAMARSLASWLRSGEVTHIACAFDHVIESFRNRLFAGYKTGDGVDPDLLAQFELAERVTRALGIVVWPMTEFEADDAIATGAAKYARAKEVTRVLLCSPDKDLAQCVQGERVVLWDRKNKAALDERGVTGKFGVPPALIPDLLALVGDTADGIPGVTRWGMKSAAGVLTAHGGLEKIPARAAEWTAKVRGAEALAASLAEARQEALLYKQLATLRTDVPLAEKLSDLKWQGGDALALEELAPEIGKVEIPLRSSA